MGAVRDNAFIFMSKAYSCLKEHTSFSFGCEWQAFEVLGYIKYKGVGSY